MRTRYARLLGAVLAAVLCLAASGPQEPLARVNDETITRADLETFIRLHMMEEGRRPTDPDQRAAWEDMERRRRREALRTMLDRRLLAQEARARYLTGENVRKTMERYAREELRELEARVGSRLEAHRMLTEMGLSAKEFKEIQKDNLLIGRLLMDKAYQNVQVTPQQMRDYYRRHRDQFRRPNRLRYRQILFTVLEPGELPRVRERAEQVLARLQEGEGFAELAARYSDDAGRFPGGLREVTLPEGYEDWRPPAIEGLEPGEAPRIRQVPGGLAIVQLESVEPARELSFEEVQAEVRDLLMEQKQDEAHESYLRRLRERATITYYPAATEELGL